MLPRDHFVSRFFLQTTMYNNVIITNIKYKSYAYQYYYTYADLVKNDTIINAIKS
jgi:hypothetical protein